MTEDTKPNAIPEEDDDPFPSEDDRAGGAGNPNDGGYAIETEEDQVEPDLTEDIHHG